MSVLLQDLRLAVRTLRNSPGYTLVVACTLALAIGANTVIFSFADTLLLRPLPIRNADDLGWIFSVDAQRGTERAPLTVRQYLDFEERARTFSEIGAATGGAVTWTGRGDPQRLAVRFVTANFLDIWGIEIAHGRGFVAGDDAAGAPRVVLLSHGYWTRQLGAADAVVGSTMVLNGDPFTVIGVASPDIEIGNLAEIDAWLPLVIDRARPEADTRRVSLTGRLAPGVIVETADAEIRTIAAQLARERVEPAGWTAHVLATRQAISGPETPVLLAMLITVVIFVLAIACANLANLTLARAAGRARELAVRAALGAGRSRIVRQLVTESLVLSLAGGLLGIGLAHAGFVIMRAASSEGIFRMVSLDARLLTFVAGLAVLAPLLFSLWPALRATRVDVSETLKDEGTRGTAGVAAGRGRAALVVTQFALAFMLLVVAGLLVRTLVNLTAIDPGYPTEQILMTSIDAPEWKHASDAEVRQFYRRVEARVGDIPGVRGVSVTTHVPALTSELPVAFEIAGRPAPTEAERPWAARSIVSTGYFQTLQLTPLGGRVFSDGDHEDAPPVAVISRETARRYWPRDDAIGARVRLENVEGWVEVVGIVRDLANADLDRAPNPQILLPASQHPTRAMSLLVGAAGSPGGLAASVRAAVREVDADTALSRVEVVRDRLDQELSSGVVLIGLFLSFGVVALGLASAGLYGVMAYGVSQRTREIGIRLALGAAPRQVSRMIGRQAAMLIGIGSAIGSVGGYLLGAAMQSVLYGVGAADAMTYAVVAVTLIAVSALATWIPTRRAMRIDPARTLRA